MAVLEMQRISICALKKNRKAVLELLQRRGVVEISDDIEQDDTFKRSDTAARCETFIKSAALCTQAIAVLDKYAKIKPPLLAGLSDNPVRSDADYYEFYSVSSKVMDKAYLIIKQSRLIAEKEAETVKLRGLITALEPWRELDIPMKYNDTGLCSDFIGYLPGALDADAALALLRQKDEKLPPLHIEVIGAMQKNTCVFVICRKKDREQTETVLRECGFSYPTADTGKTPAAQIDEYTEKISSLADERVAAIEEIRSLASARTELTFGVDYFNMRREKYAVLGRLCQSKHTFLLTGFVPRRCASALTDELTTKYDTFVECTDLAENEEAPVLLKNDGFAAPMEGVLESYSLPGKGELDPSPVMSIFYYIFFGMMFSDAGYGIIMALATGILLLIKKNSPKKQFLKMFFFCGISTAFWGFMFGSFFGDAIEVIGRTFFNAQWATPCLWMQPIKDPMKMLVYTMGIGVFHLFVGLVMGIITKIKNKEFFNAFADYFIWIVLVGSLAVMLVGSPLFASIAQMTISLPAWLTTGATYAAIASAVFVAIFSGRSSRNIFKRFAKGLYALYGITGYLGDVLSYSRLLALGLATGVVAQVVNQMGSMAGGGVKGVIIFALVFIVGHLLNFAINVLGAYVHTNRLQYVEFFGKFYEGGGRKFAPFKINNKYFNIREEKHNG